MTRSRPLPAAPAGLWERPDMAKALADRDMGTVLKIYRQWTGASQPQIATMTGVPQSAISDILNGKRQVTALDMFERFASGLDIPRQLLGLAPDASAVTDTPDPAVERPGPDRRTVLAAGMTAAVDASAGSGAVLPHEDAVTLMSRDDWTRKDTEELAELLETGRGSPVDAAAATRLAHEWLVAEPPQVVEVRSGRNIGEGLIEKIEGRVARLRRMDDFIGGKDLNPLVERELAATVDVLRNAVYDERRGKRLLSVVAELCQLAGWVAADAGLYPTAARYFTGGVKAAHAAGDRPVTANLISTLSYQVANQGDPREAVLLARTACRGASHSASATTRALLKERVAWAHARAGELRNTEKALTDVERLYDQRNPSDDPPWVYWLDEDEISVMAGRCYVELRKPLRAEPLLADAVARYNETRAREVALYRTWLAEAYVQRGEIDQAAAEATRALLLDAQANSARSADRIQDVRRKLRPYRATSQVRQFEDLYRTLTDPGSGSSPKQGHQP